MSDVGDAAALVGVATGIVGMVSGVAALLLNWATRRDVLTAQRPVIEIVERLPGNQSAAYPEWTALQLRLRSRSNLGFKGEDIRVIWPPSSRLEKLVAVGRTPSGDSAYASFTGKRSLPLRVSVAHAGSETQRTIAGTIYGSGDSHHEDLFFKASPSMWSRITRNLNKRRSDSSQRVWACFIVRLTDQNAVTTLHRRTVRLTIRTTDTTQTGTTP